MTKLNDMHTIGVTALPVPEDGAECKAGEADKTGNVVPAAGPVSVGRDVRAMPNPEARWLAAGRKAREVRGGDGYDTAEEAAPFDMFDGFCQDIGEHSDQLPASFDELDTIDRAALYGYICGLLDESRKETR